MSNTCEYSGLPSTQSYATNPQTQPEGAGVGGESLKENFIDSSPNSKVTGSISGDSEKLHKIYEKLERDFMYNWIREKSGKKKPNPKQMDGIESDKPFVKTRKKKQK